MKIQSSDTSFTGVRFPYHAGMKDVENIKQFLNNENNMEFIKKLNSNSIDIYFANGVEKVGFSHPRYGSLTKYGAQEVPAIEFSQDIENTMAKISKAIKKVQQAWVKHSDDFRGC